MPGPVARTGVVLDLAAGALTLAMRLLPWRACLVLGGLVGRIGASLPSRKSLRVVTNLVRAGAPDPRDSCRRAWSHASTTLTEMIWSTTRSPAQVWRHVSVEGLSTLREAAASGRGVLLVSAHVGNWEMVAQAATLAGIPVAVVARPIRSRAMERRLIAFRGRCGVRTLIRGRSGASLAAARWLRKGGLLACMVDRASGGRRIGIPFLGGVTNVPLGPFELARWSDSIVILGCGRRLEDGGTLVTFRRISNGTRAEAGETAGLVTRALEDYIRRCPEQWLWIYRRQRLVIEPPPRD